MKIAESTNSIARLGHALSDPTRIKILLILKNEPAFPSDIAVEARVSRQVISNHLTCLRGCGLVIATQDGVRTQYELADKRLGEALNTLLDLKITVDPGSKCGHNLKEACC